MKPRVELQQILLDALDDLGGSAHFMDVYKLIWKKHHAKLTSPEMNGSIDGNMN